MFYTVYKITNMVNDKIYIGVHKTTDLSDNYMVCPHCGKESDSLPNMKRWHFDNCKQKSL